MIEGRRHAASIDLTHCDQCLIDRLSCHEAARSAAGKSIPGDESAGLRQLQ
jgi:hypothetical protein